MAYGFRRSTYSNYNRRPTGTRYGARRMSMATKRATEAAFRRGVKSGMRKRGSNGRRTYVYR